VRRYVAVVFDDFVSGLTPVYTASTFDQVLASFDRVSLQVVVDRVGGISPRINVSIRTSGDARHFVEKDIRPEVSSEPLDSGRTNVIFGADISGMPSHCFARLEIRLEGTAPRGHVKIWVTGRGQGARAIDSPLCQ